MLQYIWYVIHKALSQLLSQFQNGLIKAQRNCPTESVTEMGPDSKPDAQFSRSWL